MFVTERGALLMVAGIWEITASVFLSSRGADIYKQDFRVHFDDIDRTRNLSWNLYVVYTYMYIRVKLTNVQYYFWIS